VRGEGAALGAQTVSLNKAAAHKDVNKHTEQLPPPERAAGRLETPPRCAWLALLRLLLRLLLLKLELMLLIVIKLLPLLLKLELMLLPYQWQTHPPVLKAPFCNFKCRRLPVASTAAPFAESNTLRFAHGPAGLAAAALPPASRRCFTSPFVAHLCRVTFHALVRASDTARALAGAGESAE
jgi:hypothetical protein